MSHQLMERFNPKFPPHLAQHQPAGLSFSKICIIQSLSTEEAQTGQIIYEYVKHLIESQNLKIAIEFRKIDNHREFLSVVDELLSDSIAGNSIPLLHVECHGDEQEGLIFENGGMLRWEEVSNALLKLNIATQFNLLSIFSACFGAYFLKEMGAFNPSPSWGIVAPTETIGPDEIISGFRDFYEKLLVDLDIGKAIYAIYLKKTSNGRWLGKSADQWFINQVVGYIESHCTQDAIEKRAREIRKELKKRGVISSLGSIKRHLKLLNGSDLLNQYFDRYFCVAQIPKNAQRFAATKQYVSDLLREYRSSGMYVV